MKSFLFRWGLIAFGCFSIFSGLSQLLVGEKLDETAQKLGVEQALALTSDNELHFVELDAKPDLSKRVYRTPLTEPGFVSQDTSRQYPLDPMGADAESLVGHTVSVTGHLDPRYAELQTIEYYEGESAEDGTVQAIRIFVPLLESGGSIIVMSPGFYSTDDPDFEHWITKASFTGVLSRLRDLSDNRSSLDASGMEVTSVLSDLGVSLSSDPFILFTDTDGTRRKRSSFAPLAGSANSVFIEIPPEDEPITEAFAGPVTGMIRSARVSTYAGFDRALGEQMPQSFAIVDIGTTAADINKQSTDAATTAITMGVIMLAIGGLWVFLRRRAAQRRALRIAQDLEDLELINRMAQQDQMRDAA